MEGKKTDSRLILKEKMSDNHCRNPPAHSCHQQMVVICDPIIGRGGGVSRADNVFQDTEESEDITTCYPGDGISAGLNLGPWFWSYSERVCLLRERDRLRRDEGRDRGTSLRQARCDGTWADLRWRSTPPASRRYKGKMKANVLCGFVK